MMRIDNNNNHKILRFGCNKRNCLKAVSKLIENGASKTKAIDYVHDQKDAFRREGFGKKKSFKEATAPIIKAGGGYMKALVAYIKVGIDKS